MRTESHVTDTKAVKRVLQVLPDHWVVRELTERDYGIDLLVEIFTPGLIDAKGAHAYDSSGAIFHIQIKGTGDKLKKVKTGTINYSMSRNSLQYIEKFSVPFFLFRLSTAPGASRVYFVWLQRYIKERLDYDCPDWRERGEDTVVIKIPPSNQVVKKIDRIGEIAYKPKFFEELIEFREYYDIWFKQIIAISEGELKKSKSIVRNLIVETQRVLRFSVLLNQNDCCIDDRCIYDLIDYLDRMLVARHVSELGVIPHEFNFELLANTLSMLTAAENFIHKQSNKPVY